MTEEKLDMMDETVKKHIETLRMENVLKFLKEIEDNGKTLFLMDDGKLVVK